MIRTCRRNNNYKYCGVCLGNRRNVTKILIYQWLFILNQCDYLITKSNHRIKSFNNQKHFFQWLCAASIGEYLNILYPEGTIFPSIFYKMIPNDRSISGLILSSLITNESNGMALHHFAIMFKTNWYQHAQNQVRILHTYHMHMSCWQTYH